VASVIEKDLHEVPAERRILDVRPWTAKTAEWLSFKENITFVAIGCFGAAFIIPLLLPLALATWTGALIINRMYRTVMPLRYPAGSFDVRTDAKGKETRPVPGLKDGDGKPVIADGIMMLGNLESTSIAARGREIWLGDDDCRKHLLILGATGSGKSETLKSICYNVLCWSSGFFIADGKADNKLATDAYTLTRRFGVDDNFLCLNFLLGGSTPQQVANARRKRSNSINPFRTSDADTIIQMGTNMMPKAEGEGKQWQEKAISLWRAEVNALCYKRDHDGIELSIDTFLEYLSLAKIEELYMEGYRRRDENTGVWPYGFDGIKAYLEAGLPGYSVEKLLRKNDSSAPVQSVPAGLGRAAPSNDQSPQALDQHGFRANQMQPALGLLANTYGHIFRHKYPEIDMVDVVLNDRVLITLIPPLEKSSQEAENLGKLTIACLRVMMARNLGTDIEGTREELIDSKATAAPYPYVVALDELGYFFSDGIAVMFAQARSLAFMMIALAQDLEKLTEGSRAAEAGAMMGNQVSKLFMRIDDAQKTWNLVKEVLGKVPVAVVRSFVRKAGGWERSEDAAIEFVEPVTLQALQGMKAGEGVLSAIGQRLHLRSLYVGEALAKNKTFRLCRFLQVPSPSQEAIDLYSDPLDVAEDPVEKGRRMMSILRGEASVEYNADPDQVLSALGQASAALPQTASAEERGISLYMVARRAILKAKESSARAAKGEAPTEESVDLKQTLDDGVEIPFTRKAAEPIVAILQQEIQKTEFSLDALDLIPGLSTPAPKAAPMKMAMPDENPAVWDQLPFLQTAQEASKHVAAPEPVPPRHEGKVLKPSEAAPDFLFDTPSFEPDTTSTGDAADSISGFDVAPRRDDATPDLAGVLAELGAFDVMLPKAVGKPEIERAAPPAASMPARETAEAAEWDESVSWAFGKLMGLESYDSTSALGRESTRAIPLDIEGRVDIPIDDQGLMIGMTEEIVTKVKRLDDLMNQPSTELSLATVEAEIAIQVTPPAPEVADDASEQMDETGLKAFFEQLTETLKG
jgi:intracellular multiplication protein IcmO